MRKLVWCFIVTNCFVGVFSCSPCKCYNGVEYPWVNLKLGECKLGLKLTKIPTNLNLDLQALNFEWQNVSRITSNNFIKYEKMQVMYIRNNKIKYVESHSFKNMTSLEILSLSENDITELPTDIFRDTPNIKKFYINNNKLTVLQKNLFLNLKYLNEINIYKNNVSIVEEGCFSGLPALEGLELRFNNLKTLSLDIEKDFKNLKSFYFAGNPWDCNLSLCDIINAYLNKQMYLKEDIFSACQSPSQLKGKKWRNLSPEDFTPLIISKENKVLQGQTLVFHCKHCLSANYTWLFNNDQLNHRDGNIRIFNEQFETTLIVMNVTEHQTGHYSCLVNYCDQCNTVSTFLKIVLPNIETTTPLLPTQRIQNITILNHQIKDMQTIYIPHWGIIFIIIVIILALTIISLICIILCCKKIKKKTYPVIDGEEEQNKIL